MYSLGLHPMSGSSTLQQSIWSRYQNEFGLVLAIIVVLGITMQFDDSYKRNTYYTITENLQQVALLGIFSLGVAVVIISGGIDLSAGTLIAFTGSVCALMTQAIAPRDEWGSFQLEAISPGGVGLGIVFALAIGTLAGTWHAWLITSIKLPPFVATLATLVGLRSLTQVMNHAVTSRMDEAGNGSMSLNVSAPLFATLREWWVAPVVFAVLCVIFWSLMNKTVLGRHLYAMGGNEQAARLSGINTDRLKWFAYSLSAFTSSVAGILYLAFNSGCTPSSTAVGYELNGIAATVVGGCSLQGGVGLIPGVILGVIFLRVVIDAVAKLVDTGSTEWTGFIVGLMVVLAVAFNELRRGSALGSKQLLPGMLGWLVIPIMTSIAGMVAFIINQGHRSQPAFLVGGAVGILLLARKVYEIRQVSRAVGSQG